MPELGVYTYTSSSSIFANPFAYAFADSIAEPTNAYTPTESRAPANTSPRPRAEPPQLAFHSKCVHPGAERHAERYQCSICHQWWAPSC